MTSILLTWTRTHGHIPASLADAAFRTEKIKLRCGQSPSSTKNDRIERPYKTMEWWCGFHLGSYAIRTATCHDYSRCIAPLVLRSSRCRPVPGRPCLRCPRDDRTAGLRHRWGRRQPGSRRCLRVYRRGDQLPCVRWPSFVRQRELRVISRPGCRCRRQPGQRIQRKVSQHQACARRILAGKLFVCLYRPRPCADPDSQGGQIMDDAYCGGGDTNEGLSSTAIPISTAAQAQIAAAIFMGDPRHIPGLSYNVGTCQASGVSLSCPSCSADSVCVPFVLILP
jgi:hypothetical protein